MKWLLNMEPLVEWELAEETDVLGENLPHCHFVHHEFHITDEESNPRRRGRKPATNHLNYTTAHYQEKSSGLLVTLVIVVCH
jgi:hypothetical protein